MATTSRFGLQSFGGSVPGSFRDSGYAYTLTDRQTIDAVLAALETHTHGGGNRLLDPGPPTLATAVDPAGHLVGGRTYYYRVGYVDQWGLETAASDEVAITLPAGPPTPTPPSPELSTGGSLGAGSYYYAIAAYVGSETRQTLASQTVFVTLSGSFNKVILHFPAAHADADGWVVYRRGPQETQLYHLAVVPKASATYTDSGTVISDCTKTPATTDTTATSNSVTVSIAAADQDPVTVTVTSSVLGSSGSLAAGTYDYRIRPSVTLSGTTYYGDVTDVTVTVPSSGSTAQFSVVYSGGEFVGPTPPDVSVELYGRTSASYKLMDSDVIAGGDTTVVVTDNGSSAGTTVYVAQTSNWTAPPLEVSAWKIYRSSNSGHYPSTSLVKFVVETEAGDSGGNLVMSWTDMGNPLLSGTPRSRSTTFQPPAALTLNTQAETCLYTPLAGSPLDGPTVADALDSVGALVFYQRTRTYTFMSSTGPLTGVARYYPGVPFKITRIRAALSNAISVTYNVRVNGTALYGTAQAASVAGLTTAAVPPDVSYADDAYITVDLVSGTIATGQALVIHIDLQPVV